MPTLSDLLHTQADLEEPDIEWLHLLVGDWQMISDLSFADLVLWVPDRSGDGWVAVAHCRPSTGATVYYDDVVGVRAPRGRRVQVDRAWQLRRICRDRDPEWHDDIPVREEAIPVVRRDRAIAVVTRHTNLAAARTPSRLELTYLQCADDLARMVAAGDFPVAGAPTGPRRGAPRVGDGLIRLDRDGRVAYASPNAMSALHRLGFVGDVLDRSLSELTTALLDTGGLVDESLPLVLSGRAPWRSDVEARGTTLSLRAIPLTAAGARIGALVLVRDVSELRRRERELLTKDATIREVHHRVKNNLQTVASLLRLQARRIPSHEGRLALNEAMRRVATIALVHETLSEGLGETVDFDAVVERIVALAVELAGAGAPVEMHREGSFEELRAENATPLALVLTELVTNAVEHGLATGGGRVSISAERVGRRLRAVVHDDGVGLPEGFVAGTDGLGTQIVQALVGGEMRGHIDWSSPPGGGTSVTVEVTVRAIGPDSDPGEPATDEAVPDEPGIVEPDVLQPEILPPGIRHAGLLPRAAEILTAGGAEALSGADGLPAGSALRLSPVDPQDPGDSAAASRRFAAELALESLRSSMTARPDPDPNVPDPEEPEPHIMDAHMLGEHLLEGHSGDREGQLSENGLAGVLVSRPEGGALPAEGLGLPAAQETVRNGSATSLETLPTGAVPGTAAVSSTEGSPGSAESS